MQNTFLLFASTFLFACGIETQTKLTPSPPQVLKNQRFATYQLRVLQKREAMSDQKLPEEFRVALAKAFQDDLFSKVLVGYLL
jgi:hypothetical protein